MIKIARSSFAGTHLLTCQPKHRRAATVAAVIIAVLSTGCCKTCPSPEEPEACPSCSETSGDGTRQFWSQTLSKTGRPWAVGNNCKRNDLNPPPPKTNVYSMGENTATNEWVCGP